MEKMAVARALSRLALKIEKVAASAYARMT
jgi:hypothetical protein